MALKSGKRAGRFRRFAGRIRAARCSAEEASRRPRQKSGRRRSMVETWPGGEDQRGKYQDTLSLFDITEDRFVVSMDRHYVDGPTIEGVWRYFATRREE